uniref:RxLR effector candidate protein n=1 Tax=Hyaloperonospora arabidopsidis (strain Emoy2) TaxID=559515 RepID=A0A090B8G1_HYAAE|nr:RxLR effector candidate protein [Hyaloperonospora arabidopsidis Emoy2]
MSRYLLCLVLTTRSRFGICPWKRTLRLLCLLMGKTARQNWTCHRSCCSSIRVRLTSRSCIFIRSAQVCS